jgi:NADH:ubiquinone oxidoreductase subunit 5 (subunit L)/multisubunit Na+/H+ antiporter MnhA subunit
MWIPIVVLALFSIAAGFVGVTPEHGLFHNFLGQGLLYGVRQGGNVPLQVPIALLPLGVASVGMALAYLSYVQWWDLSGRLRGLYVLLFRRYYVDEMYYAVFLDGFRRFCHRLWKIDMKVIDGAVNKVAGLVLDVGVLSSKVDDTVVDGAVNKVADLVLYTSAISSKVDDTVVDGAVNKVADLVLYTSAISSKVDDTVVDGAVNKVADLVLRASAISSKVDDTVVDGAVNKVADLVLRASATWRRLQTGLVQNYLLAMAVGILVIALIMIFR